MAAVDAKVGAWVLQHALLGPLLWGAEEEGGKEPLQPRQQPQQQQQQHQQARSRPRTVVVATHSPELMAAADVVLEMQGGRGTAVRHQPGGVERRQAADAAIAATVDEPTHQAGPASKRSTDAAEASEQAGAASEAEPSGLPQQAAEERQMGHVRWGVYRRYAAATGWGLAALILSSLVLMQARERQGCRACSVAGAGGGGDAAAAAAAAAGSLPCACQRGSPHMHPEPCPVLLRCSRLVCTPSVGHPQRQRPLVEPLGVPDGSHARPHSTAAAA